MILMAAPLIPILLRLLPMIVGLIASRGGTAIGTRVLGGLGRSAAAQGAKRGIAGMVGKAAARPSLQSLGARYLQARAGMPRAIQGAFPGSMATAGQAASGLGQSLANEMMFTLPAFYGGHVLTEGALNLAGFGEPYEPAGAESLVGPPAQQQDIGPIIAALLQELDMGDNENPEIETLLSALPQQLI